VREVRWQERLGDATYLYLDSGTPDAPWIVKAPGRAHAQAGQRLAVGLPPAALHLFDARGQALPRLLPATDLPLPAAA
jgi:multiple sugar transport system ATP-binding protein